MKKEKKKKEKQVFDQFKVFDDFKVTENLRKVNYIPHLEWLNGKCKLETEAYQVFKCTEENFEKFLQGILEHEKPKEIVAFKINMQLLHKNISLSSFTPSSSFTSSSIFSSSEIETNTFNDPFFSIKNAINSFEKYSVKLLKAVYFLIKKKLLHWNCLWTIYKWYSLLLFKKNSSKDFHIFPEEFIKDLWDLISNTNIKEKVSSIESLRNALGNLITQRRRNKTLGNKPEYYFSNYKGKPLKPIIIKKEKNEKKEILKRKSNENKENSSYKKRKKSEEEKENNVNDDQISLSSDELKIIKEFRKQQKEKSEEKIEENRDISIFGDEDEDIFKW